MITLFAEKKIIFIHIFLIFIWVFFNFHFLIDCGFYGDDIWNAQIKGQIINESISLNQRIINEWKGWLLNNGSIRILYYYIIYPSFYYHYDPQIYKFITLFFLSLSSVSLYFLSNLIIKNKKISFLISILVITFFQLRTWNDPILGFPSFMMPFLLPLLISSIIFYLIYLDTSKLRYNLISCILFIISIFIYEITVPFGFIYLTLALNKYNCWSESIKKSIIQNLSLFIYLAIIFLVNVIYIPYILNSDISYSAVQFHLSSLSKFLHAFIIQLYGSFPLSYFFSQNIDLKKIISIPEMLFIFSFSLIVYHYLKNLTLKLNINVKHNLLIIGSYLLVFPALLTALSGHQGDLRYLGFGNAYIPVFIQYFGLIILMFLIYLKISKLINKKILNIILFIIFNLITIINYGMNKETFNKLSDEYFLHSFVINEALENKIIDNVNKNTIVLREYVNPSDYYRNYINHTEYKLNVCDLEIIESNYKLQNCSNPLIINSDNYKNIFHNKNNTNNKINESDIWLIKIFTNSIQPYKSFALSLNLSKIEFDKTMIIRKMQIDKLLIYNYGNKNLIKKKYEMPFLASNIDDVLSTIKDEKIISD